MKIFYILLLSMLCSVMSATAQYDDWANFSRYAEANKAVKSQPAVEGRVVFIGNSITDGWIMHHPEFFSRHNYLDRGISGQVTSQILMRFKEDVIDLHPAVVVIAGGTNDAAEAAGPWSPEITLANYRSMVNMARAHGIRVIIGSLLPCAKFVWGTKPDDAPGRIELMNRLLRQYCESEDIPFADYYPHMVVGEEKALNPAWTFDNIHPTLEGYKVMESVVQPLIEQELSKCKDGRSLDEVERKSYGATVSPVDYDGIEMQEVKSVSISAQPKVMSLDGEWQLMESVPMPSDWNDAIWAKVPGSVHAALVASGKIPDPTIGKNDSIAEMKSYRDWWYRKVFRYNENWKNVMLSFAGVANKCTVYLNGKELGRHEGMMGGPDFVVTDNLIKGDNELLVHLSPIPDFGRTGANLSWTSTVVANCVYGWHYVKIPTLGLWQSVELKQLPDNAIENPFIFTRNVDGSMRLVVDLPHAVDKGSVNVIVSPKNFQGRPQRFTCDVSGRQGILALDFKIDNPHLWWPNGSGDQALYTASISFEIGKGVKDSKTLTFGVRTIEMRPVGGRADSATYNWQFVVNNRPVFIKGTNWCLMDFMMDLSPERYNRFLGAVKEQHVNLLRAWGGGLVETNRFYDMCDEMGLMVLQEWPTAWNSHRFQNPDVLKETIDRNTYRIRSHPSLVMWAGGNESDDPHGDIIDYMGRVSVSRDGTRPFHRGEPWGGSVHNHDSWWLDLHFNNALNMNAVFMGEFGMPSLPVRETVDRYLDGEVFKVPLDSNSVFEHHGPTFGAWQDMRLLFRQVGFILEPTTLDKMILGSQLAQTLGTRRALERARTLWPDKTAGVCYYKINDVYPGLSWGSVDYYGAKKATHYFLKRSGEPLMPVIVFDQTNLTGRDASLPYYLIDDNGTCKNQMLIAKVAVYDRLMKKLVERTDTIVPDCYTNRLPDVKLTVAQTATPLLYFMTEVRDTDGRLLARNWYIENFDSKQDAIFDAPKCQLRVDRDGYNLSITNESETIPAVGVDITVPGETATLNLSDNMLWINPGETIKVTTNTDSKASISAWNM